MPVARDTTSAISSAPTCVRSSLRLLRLSLRAVGLLELRFQLRQPAVLQLGHLLPVALALAPLPSAACSFSISSLMCCAALHLRPSRPSRSSSRSAYSRSSRSISSSISARRLLRGLVLLLLHRLALDLQLDQAALEPVHRLRLGVDLHLDARRRLVDQVDRLVGQEAVGDVAVRQLGRGDDRRVGDLDAVVHLVSLLQAAQDGDGGLDARLVDQHLLEAPLERRILLDVLAVFVQRGGADAVQLAARERGLEHVAGVDRAFGLAGADHACAARR